MGYTLDPLIFPICLLRKNRVDLKKICLFKTKTMTENLENENSSVIPQLLTLLIENALLKKHSDPNYLSFIFRIYHNYSKDINKLLPDFQQIRVMFIKDFFSKNSHDLIQLETLLQRLSKQRVPRNKSSLLFLLYQISAQRIQEFCPMYSLQKLPNPLNSLMKFSQKENSQLKGVFLSDEMIMKDLIFVFQGLDGSFLRYNRAQNYYELIPTRAILGFKNKSQEILSLKLTETGFLFRRISQEMSQNTFVNKSLIKTYLLEIFSDEIKRFYSILNSLESQIALTKKFSLKSLLIMISQEHERLKWLNILWDSAIKSGAIGCQILNAIYQFFFMSDPANKIFFLNFLIHIMKPLFQYISKWIGSGELFDQSQEFFIEDRENSRDFPKKNQGSSIIQENSEKTEKNFHFWTQKFKLSLEKTPNFWCFQTMQKILTCGKTAYFLRKCCGKYNWELSSTVFLANEKSFSGFEDWMDDKLQTTNSKAISVLFDEFHFREELKLLKGYLLMGDGFFMELLLSGIKEELKKPCNQIYRHILMGILEKTLRKTVQNTNIRKKLLERLMIIYVKRSSIIDIGWDLFSLDIGFQDPISQIITENERNIYSKLFNFLVKIKRFQLEIQEIWKKTLLITRLMRRKGFSEGKNKEKETFHMLKQAEITRNLMGFFLNNFLEFLLIEGIESEWNLFESQELGQCKSIDEIIEAHKRFLLKLQKKFMLLPDHQPIINSISQLFEHIKAFVIINNSILNDLQNFLMKIQTNDLMKNMQNALLDEESEFNQSGSLEDLSNNFTEFEAKLKFPKTIIEIKIEFERTLVDFLTLLEKHQLKTTLALKLNYNEFLEIKSFELLEKQANILKYEDIGKLLSPKKIEKMVFEKRNSSPDIKKIFLRVFEEEDEIVLPKGKGDEYINVFE